MYSHTWAHRTPWHVGDICLFVFTHPNGCTMLCILIVFSACGGIRTGTSILTGSSTRAGTGCTDVQLISSNVTDCQTLIWPGTISKLESPLIKHSVYSTGAQHYMYALLSFSFSFTNFNVQLIFKNKRWKDQKDCKPIDTISILKKRGGVLTFRMGL